ncbi:MAG: hypothetical protein QOH11_2362, partial [Solirubrobacteraceae bacterium]|nr:hypothetical protein [Solirubrobacteraceae bacterium]
AAAGLSQPSVGRSANVARASGVVRVKVRGGRRFVRLTRPRQIPIGSSIDASRGAVRLTTAAGGRRTQTGVFSGGIFSIAQRPERHPVTELVLRGSVGGCPASSAARLPGRVLRRLRGSAHGRYRTRGRYSAATVRGTVWNTEDRCDGTLIDVSRGSASASDLGAARLVRPNESFIAWCSPTGDYCKNAQSFGRTARLRLGTFAFEGPYGLCVTAPDASRACRNFPLSRPDRFGIMSSSVAWEASFPNRGPGIYQAEWSLGGTRLGPVLPFQIGG